METFVSFSLLILWHHVLFVIGVADGSLCTNGTTNAIDICAKETVTQDQNIHNILLGVSSKQECQCRLSIQNQNETIMVLFKKYEDIDNSVPSEDYCGVVVNFESNNERIWKLHCKLSSNTVLNYPIPANRDMFITSESVDGLVKGGYCIEIVKLDNTRTNKLSLECGLNVTQIQTTTTPVIATTTTTRALTATTSIAASSPTTRFSTTMQTTRFSTTIPTTRDISTSPTTRDISTSPTTTSGRTMLSTTSVTSYSTSTTTSDGAATLTTESDNYNDTTNSTASMNATFVPVMSEQNDPVNWELYMALGISLFVLIIVIVIVIIVCRRYRKSNPAEQIVDYKRSFNLENSDWNIEDKPLYNSADLTYSHAKRIKQASDRLNKVKHSKYSRFDNAFQDKNKTLSSSLTNSKPQKMLQTIDKSKIDNEMLQLKSDNCFSSRVTVNLEEKPKTMEEMSEKSRTNNYDTLFPSKHKVKQEEFERVPKNRIGYLYYYNSQDI